MDVGEWPQESQENLRHQRLEDRYDACSVQEHRVKHRLDVNFSNVHNLWDRCLFDFRPRKYKLREAEHTGEEPYLTAEERAKAEAKREKAEAKKKARSDEASPKRGKSQSSMSDVRVRDRLMGGPPAAEWL